MRAGFQEMRATLGTEWGAEMRSGFQVIHTTLGTEMRVGFEAMNKRFDRLSADFADLRRDFGSRTDTLAHYVHLTDQGYFKMGDRLFNLEQRVDRLESTQPHSHGQTLPN
jgi:hypothetical protein